MMTSHSDLIIGTEFIVCPVCNKKSTRVGTQDYCDIYVCEEQHLTRIKINALRKEWVNDNTGT